MKKLIRQSYFSCNNILLIFFALLLLNPQNIQAVDHSILIEAIEATQSESTMTNDQKALILRHFDAIRELRKSDTIDNHQFQNAIRWYRIEIDPVAKKAASDLGFHANEQQNSSEGRVGIAQVIPTEGLEYKTTSDTDMFIKRKSGKQDITLEDVQRVDRQFRILLKEKIKILSKNVDTSGDFKAELDYMVNPDDTNPVEFERIYHYFKAKGSATYKRPEAAIVEAKIRSKQSFTPIEAQRYIEEMIDQTNAKSKPNDREKYIKRIDKISKILVDRYGLGTLESSLNDDGHFSQNAQARLIEILGKVASSPSLEPSMKKQIGFNIALKIHDLPDAERQALLKILPRDIQKVIQSNIYKMNELAIDSNEAIRVRDFLRKSEGGRKLLTKYDWIFKELTKERGQRKHNVANVADIFKSLSSTGTQVGSYAYSMSMWLDVMRQIKGANTDAQLAISLGKTLASKTYYGMVAGYLYTGLVERDGTALAKALIIYFCPSAALPEVVQSIGDSVIDIASSVMFDRQFMALYMASKFDPQSGKLLKMGEYIDKEGVCQFLDETIEQNGDNLNGIFDAATKLAKEKNLAQDWLNGVSEISRLALYKAITSTIYGGNPLVLQSYAPLASSCMAVANYTKAINDYTAGLGYTNKIPNSEESASIVDNSPYFINFGEDAKRPLRKLIKQRADLWKGVKSNLCKGIVQSLESRHKAEIALNKDNGEEAKRLFERIKTVLKELGIEVLGMKRLEAEGATNIIMRNFISTPRDQQIKAMKTVQRYLKNYEKVLNYRDQIQTYYKFLTNQTLSVKPLTNTPPLAIDPEFDVVLASGYMDEIVTSVKKIEGDWLYIKRRALNDQLAELDSDFDKKMLTLYYHEIFEHAYQDSITKGAKQGLKLPSYVISTMQHLISDNIYRSKSSKAYAKMSETWEKRKLINREFKEYYENIKSEITILVPQEIQNREGRAGVEYYFDTNSSLIPHEANYIWYLDDQKIAIGKSIEYSFKKEGKYKLKLIVTWEKSERHTKAGHKESKISFHISKADQKNSNDNDNILIPPQQDHKVENEEKNDQGIASDDTPTLQDQNGGVTNDGEDNEQSISNDAQRPAQQNGGKTQDQNHIDNRANNKSTTKNDTKDENQVENANGNDATSDNVSSQSIQEKIALQVTAGTNWKGKVDEEGFSFKRDPEDGPMRKSPAMCYSDESEDPLTRNGDVSAKLMGSSIPDTLSDLWGANSVTVTDIRNSLNKDKKEDESIESLQIGKFKGYILINEPRYKRGGCSIESGFWHAKSSMGGYGVLTDGMNYLEVRFSAGAQGLFDDKDRSWLISNAKKISQEAKAILSSIRIVKTPKRITTKYVHIPDLEVTLQATPDKPCYLGQTIKVSAEVKGGKPPYMTYQWSGDHGGKGKEVLFASRKEGDHTLSLTVTDSKGNSATASVTIKVKALDVKIKQVKPTSGSTILLGTSVEFEAKFQDNPNLETLWQPHPEVTFKPFELSTTTQATFPTEDNYKVWVQVYLREGEVRSLVGESEQLSIDVKAPILALSASTTTPFVGEEVIVTVAEDPKVADETINFWWEYKGAVLSAGVEANAKNDRSYSFIPKDTKPITITVHAKAKDGGADLGEKSITIEAKKYSVAVSKAKRLDRAPWIWDAKKGKAVELPLAISVFQNAEVFATVTPKPKGKVNYRWSITPDGCTITALSSKSTYLNAHEKKTYQYCVKVSDKNGVQLGKACDSLTITISQRDLDILQQKEKDQLKARELLDEARKLWQEGKLQQAISKAVQATTLDKTNKEIDKTLQTMQNQKSSIDDRLQKVDKLIAGKKSKDAESMLKKAGYINKNYPQYIDMSKKLQNLKEDEQATQDADSQTSDVANTANDTDKEATDVDDQKMPNQGDNDKANQNSALPENISITDDQINIGDSTQNVNQTGSNINGDETNQSDNITQTRSKNNENETSITSVGKGSPRNSGKPSTVGRGVPRSPDGSLQSGNSSASLTIDKKIYEPNENIQLNFTSSPEENAWIGMYVGKVKHAYDTPNITYQNCDSKASGKRIFGAPNKEGEYQFRLYGRKDRRELAVLPFTVKVDKDAASLTINKKIYEPNEKIQLDFKATPLQNAWIGMYVGKVKHAYDTPNITYQNCDSKASGKRVFGAPNKEGRYEFRLYERTNHKELAVLPFVVKVDNDAANLMIDKAVYEPNEKIQLDFKATPLQNAWIGMYVGKVKHAYDTPNITYQNCDSKASGKRVFGAPNKEGRYEFRLYERTNHKELVVIPFIVQVKKEAATLQINKKIYEPHEKIQLDFTSTPLQNAWIGMYESGAKHTYNTSHITWQNCDSKASGIREFIAPQKEGEYQLRLYERTNKKELTITPFAVRVKKEAATLTIPKSNYQKGEKIRLQFTATPLQNAWIGMYESGAKHTYNTSHITWQNCDSQASGVREFIAPKKGGNYQFRLYERSNKKELVVLSFSVM